MTDTRSSTHTAPEDRPQIRVGHQRGPGSDQARPRISIGIPTFNRADLLPRAVASAFAQTTGDFEIIIADNGSTDTTESLCRALAAHDPRVRYIRHARNRGPMFNYFYVLSEARGLYFMWLADDDWLDPNYVSACSAWLDAHPDYVVAAGRSVKHFPDGTTSHDVPMHVDGDSPIRRYLQFFLQVGHNSMFYGLIRSAPLRQVTPPADIVGADWFVSAALCYLGKVQTLDSTEIHLAMTGVSAQPGGLARDFGLSGLVLDLPFVGVSLNVVREVLHQHVYRKTPAAQRISLGLAAASIVVVRRHVVPDLFVWFRARLYRTGLRRWARRLLTRR